MTTECVVEAIQLDSPIPQFIVLVGPTGQEWAWDQEDGRPAHADYIVIEVAVVNSEDVPQFYSTHDDDEDYIGVPTTPDLARAEWAAWGTVRWDGRFECYADLDFSDIDDAQAFTVAITRAYTLAAKMSAAR